MQTRLVDTQCESITHQTSCQYHPSHSMNPPEELTSSKVCPTSEDTDASKASEGEEGTIQDIAQHVTRCTRMLGAKKSRELTREGSRQAERAGRRSGHTKRFPDREGERNKDVGETIALCQRNCPGPHRDEYDVSRPERSNTRRNG